MTNSLSFDHFSEYGSTRQEKEARAIAAELARRDQESLKLYEPHKIQKLFHQQRACEVLFQAGNRVGKSLAGFVEDARAVTGQDPYKKYPDENGVLVLVGMDQAHIGRTMHKYLFRPGSFWLIEDKRSKKLRSYRPWNKADVKRKHERVMAPPLIPERFVNQKSWSWYDKRSYAFKSVELVNGWTIYAYSSTAKPAQGFQADLIHIDEDLETYDWYAEMVARLTDRDGYLRWTALPHAKNEALTNLTERAEDEEEEHGTDYKKRDVVVCRATIFDNPHLPKKAVERNVAIWRNEGEDVYRQRALGELTTDSVLMYPSFSKQLHNGLRDDPPLHPAVAELRARGGTPPKSWCRYVTIDPGHQICAALLWAVPPPEEYGVCKFVYDEIYIPQSDAAKFANAMAAKTDGYSFQEFIFDMHGGRLTSTAGGKQPYQIYSEELERRDVRCELTQSNFTAGSPDIPGRVQVLRELMRIEKRFPALFVLIDRCPNLVRELVRFKKKKTARGVVLDEGERKRTATHAVECLEYGAHHGLVYVKPPQRLKRSSLASQLIKEKKHRKAKRRAKNAGRQYDHIPLGAIGDGVQQ